MKRIVFIFVASICSSIMFLLAQTPRVISVSNNIEPEKSLYDSLRTIKQYVNGSLDFNELVGQELFFLDNQYWCNKERYPIAVYTEIPKNIFPSSDEVYYASKEGRDYYTLYIGLCGKSFKIKDYIPPHSVSNSIFGYLVLEGPPNHPNLYIKCIESLSQLPCVVKGYDEKLRDTYISESFIPTHRLEVTNLKDKSKHIFCNTDTLKCVDVAYADDKEFQALLILSDSANNLYFANKISVDLWCISYSKLLEREAALRSELLSREQLMCDKYGEKVGRIIASGSVRIGFTKEQCIDAWGEPNAINTTTTRYGVDEQWVYESKYLYFKNGKLSAIQD